ncbi:LysM peptidoglycan-binding domain-containing protein [Vagococcus sp.]|uniref:aggregation-promoting factor n=1 Tax=Vagococcus sp. TaxID=1933889 RepID=UPI003F9531F1
MKSLKFLLFGTTMALGLFIGTQANAETVYTVKSGDSLSLISQKFAGNNSLIDEIAKLNKIQDINLIHVGQKLTINSDNQPSEPVVTEQPVQQEVVAQEVVVEQPVQEVAAETSNYQGSSSSAKEWIAQKESGGSYTATNGHHIGRYQLDPSYLNGDHSAANQERVADEYVAGRYGSWENAQSFWMNNGWY